MNFGGIKIFESKHWRPNFICFLLRCCWYFSGNIWNTIAANYGSQISDLDLQAFLKIFKQILNFVPIINFWGLSIQNNFRKKSILQVLIGEEG